MRCKYSSAQETYFEFIHVLQAMRMIFRDKLKHDRRLHGKGLFAPPTDKLSSNEKRVGKYQIYLYLVRP